MKTKMRAESVLNPLLVSLGEILKHIKHLQNLRFKTVAYTLCFTWTVVLQGILTSLEDSLDIFDSFLSLAKFLTISNNRLFWGLWHFSVRYFTSNREHK